MGLEKLVSREMLPILFIGSGFSRRYIGLPDWEGLLKQVYSVMGYEEKAYKALKIKIMSEPKNRSLTNGEVNAIIATIIEEEFNRFYFESELIETHSHWLEEETSPFKNCIAEIIIKSSQTVEEKIEELSAFKKLRGKISSIITTNYDTLLEDLFGFHKDSIFIGQSQIFSPLSVEVDELYKIHGCISEPSQIIITQGDYNHFKDHSKLFSAKLLTLISENPVIFIGYGIGDPNVQQTLVDLVGCLKKEQIENLQNHFYIIDYKPGLQELEESTFIFSARSYEGREITFPISIIRTDNYLEIFNQLSTLTPAMNINAVKQVKRIIKEIVVESQSTKQIPEPIITVLLEDIHKISKDQKLAIAIGNISTINEYGYGIKPHIEIFEDILLNNKNIDPFKILKGTYEKHYLKIHQNLPIYKYVKDIGADLLEECPKVRNYIENHSTLESYLNTQLVRTLRNISEGNDINNIPKEYNGTLRRRYLWIFKNIYNINIEDLKEFIYSELQHYEAFESNDRSFFNRLISMYDFIVYK